MTKKSLKYVFDDYEITIDNDGNMSIMSDDITTVNVAYQYQRLTIDGITFDFPMVKFTGLAKSLNLEDYYRAKSLRSGEVSSPDLRSGEVSLSQEVNLSQDGQVSAFQEVATSYQAGRKLLAQSLPL